jgi:hypothetical protein
MQEPNREQPSCEPDAPHETVLLDSDAFHR